MRLIKSYYKSLLIATCAGAITVATTVVSAQDQQETSLLLNQPDQSGSELPDLPPPTDPQAAAPRSEPTLPSPTTARPTSSGRRSFMRPVEEDIATRSVPAGAVPMSENLPAPPSEAPIVRPVADIKYDTDRGARKLLAASLSTIDTLMIAHNPADGCLYEIPLCLPGCCVEEPQVEHRRGLLGRGVVEYCWPCGLEVKVIFRLRGDVKVEYDA